MEIYKSQNFSSHYEEYKNKSVLYCQIMLNCANLNELHNRSEEALFYFKKGLEISVAIFGDSHYFSILFRKKMNFYHTSNYF